MRRLPLLLAAYALAVLAIAAPASAAGGALRVTGVDTSAFPTVRVTVKAPKAGATPQFSVSENGQPVSGFSLDDPGAAAAIALAIDTSKSMHGKPLHDAIAAASRFVDGRHDGDLLGVFGFGSKAYQAAPLAADRTGAVSAISQLATDTAPGTAIYAAVKDASAALASANARKRILIVLTDGASVHDAATLPQAIGAARAAGIVVYAVATSSDALTTTPLERLSGATGGKMLLAGDSGALDAAYASLSDELGRTYTFSYRSLAPRGRPLRLAVAAPGMAPARTHATAPGHYRPPVVPKASSGPIPASGRGRLLVVLLTGLFVLVGVLVLMAAKPAVVLARRIDPFTTARKATGDGENGPEPPAIGLLQQLYVVTEKLAGSLNYWKKTSFRLEQADLPLRTAEVVYIQLGAGLVCGLLAMLLTGGGGVVALVGMAIGAALPAVYVRIKAKRRLAAFENQLPETLITLAASLKAGHAFNAAVTSVVREGAEPTAKEFQRVVTETQLGMPAEEALETMAQRMESYNFGFVVMAVNIQRTVGGSLAEILDMVADTVRQRQQFAKKVKALTAQGRASAYTLIAMPFFMALALYALNSSYVSILFTSSAGRVLVLGALVMMGIGSVVIRKIVSFKG